MHCQKDAWANLDMLLSHTVSSRVHSNPCPQHYPPAMYPLQWLVKSVPDPVILALIGTYVQI